MLQKLMIIIFLASVISLQAFDSAWGKYKQHSLENHHKIPGWCKKEKAEKLMDLIHDMQPKICIEIGVFRGSSVYPIAKALKYAKKGIVYAVDPWDKDEALKFEVDKGNIDCWGNINYEKTYRKFIKMLKKNDLRKYCKVLRTTAEKALSQFKNESIDFIHIDGNHNEESCMLDVEMSLRKLKKGGYLLFDDANWHQTQKAVAYLNQHCKIERKYSINDECLLFRKH